MNKTVVSLAILIYNFCLVAGTAYLCAVHDWSLWTFLLALLFMMGMHDGTNKKSPTDRD